MTTKNKAKKKTATPATTAKATTKAKSNLPPAATARDDGRRLNDLAFRFRESADVEFAGAESGNASLGRFKMTAMTGKPFKHPFWGNFALDLETLEFKDSIPTLREHLRERVVGFTNSVDVSPRKGIKVEGVFSQSTQDGAEVEATLKEGFPWEASVAVPPKRIEFVEDGHEVKVNGHKLRGPGTIFRDAALREVSFVSLGADPGTKVASFSAPTEGQIIDSFTSSEEEDMSKPADVQTDDNVESQQTPEPNKFTEADKEEIRSEAIKVERERISAINSASFAGQDEIVKKAIDENWPVDKACLAFIEDEKGKNKKRLEEFQKDEIPATGSSDGSDEPAFDPDKQKFDEKSFGDYWDNDAEDDLKSAFFGDKASFIAYYRNRTDYPGK